MTSNSSADLGRRGRWLRRTAAKGAIVVTTVSLSLTTATAQSVRVCSGLGLYGNAAFEGLCKSLSPTTQNLWVCGMTTGITDVHVTFNATTAMHITVRINPASPTCEGLAYMRGTFPNRFSLSPAQPTVICGVNVADYVARLNAVGAMPAIPGLSACQAAFDEAAGTLRLNSNIAGSYMNSCKKARCP